MTIIQTYAVIFFYGPRKHSDTDRSHSLNTFSAFFHSPKDDPRVYPRKLNSNRGNKIITRENTLWWSRFLWSKFSQALLSQIIDLIVLRICSFQMAISNWSKRLSRMKDTFHGRSWIHQRHEFKDYNSIGKILLNTGPV